MNDLIITIFKNSRKVKLNREFVGFTGENLQGDIIVDFDNNADYIDGECKLELDRNGEKTKIDLTKNANKTYSTPITASLLSTACTMKGQVVITQEATDNGVPTFKSEVFKLPCGESINAE